MEHVGGFAHKITTSLSFDDAITTVTDRLKDAGFGVLTEIDVTGTLKKKLDLDYKPFRILGACNPPFAHKMLETSHFVSVLMPCNVAVWDEGDHRVVAAMDVRMVNQLLDSPEVAEMTAELNGRLEGVLAGLED